MSELELTETELRKYGRRARASVPRVTNNCGAIVDSFEGHLNDTAGLPWSDIPVPYGRAEVRVGEDGKQKHYVFYIDGTYLEDYQPREEVIIDLSFDQFCKENLEQGEVSVSYGACEDTESEKFRVMGPGDDRLKQYSFFMGESLFERSESVASHCGGV